MKAIAKRLKTLRTQKGLSVAKVARLVGVSESTYREWEHGRAIQGEPYLKLAEVFDVNINQILADVNHDDSWLIEQLHLIESLARNLRLSL